MGDFLGPGLLPDWARFGPLMAQLDPNAAQEAVVDMKAMMEKAIAGALGYAGATLGLWMEAIGGAVDGR